MGWQYFTNTVIFQWYTLVSFRPPAIIVVNQYLYIYIFKSFFFFTKLRAHKTVTRVLLHRQNSNHVFDLNCVFNPRCFTFGRNVEKNPFRNSAPPRLRRTQCRHTERAILYIYIYYMEVYTAVSRCKCTINIYGIYFAGYVRFVVNVFYRTAVNFL